MSHVTFLFHFSIGQNRGANQWRVCYQRGLPRLVYQQTNQIKSGVLFTLVEQVINKGLISKARTGSCEKPCLCLGIDYSPALELSLQPCPRALITALP